MVPDSKLQLIFKKLSLVKFRCHIKEHPQLSEQAIPFFSKYLLM